MNSPHPHYLLYSKASTSDKTGHWRFVLREVDGADCFEAADNEPEVRGERLELLTVVRALESLDQPSRVTLVCSSDYVRRGLRNGLPEWRTSGWRWECFGRLVPVKDHDLWQRVDRALRFHRVQWKTRRFDLPHASIPGPCVAAAGDDGARGPTNKGGGSANVCRTGEYRPSGRG
ncbi:MAG: hypothetical protein HQ581_11735 [Planctomycetes bacterium]|nr:hypothetical protein [Planctomycetota bacterium]